MVVTTTAMLLCVGLAVDLGGTVQEQQRTRDLAAQAARVGGQQLAGADAIQGDVVRVDPVAAVNAAEAFLRSSGVQGTVRIVGGTYLVVTTRSTYQTKVLGIVGIGSTNVTGEATARIVRVVEGVEQ